MKAKSKLKLNQLNKNAMEPRQTSQLMGGNYCAWGPDNYAANEAGGVCSCVCGGDYYGSSGLDYYATWYRDTTMRGYC